MTKLAVRHLLLLVVFSIFCTSRIFSQTIATHDVDAGPYAPGSTVAIPFHVDNGTSFIDPTNSFTLVMSDASGNFSPGTTVATLPNSFYATYFNYTLPAGTAAGNYKFIVKASNPATSSAASTAITVNATGTVPTAGVSTSPAIGSGGETFGQCNNPSSPYFFSSTSTNATATTASFFNEGTQTMQVSNQAVTIYVFAAQTTNYTIIAKAKSTDGVTYSTKAYQLINNKANASLPSSGNNTACLTSGSALLTFGIDYTSANGIQFNYPGDTYTISWGDGGPATTYTLAQLISLSGIVFHSYSRVSCGNVANGQNNSFEVDLDVSNKFCGTVGTRATSYAKIVIAPTNFTAPPPSGVACTNTAVTFVNGSIPGPDPNASSPSCAENPNVRYIWQVDGVTQAANYRRSDNFVWTFTTNGTHTVTLKEQVGNGICAAADYTATICIQDPPTAAFTIPAGPICATSPLTPVNTSTVDVGCGAAPTYQWTITPNTYTLAGGSTLTSATPPSINFTNSDTYTIGLTITPVSCNPSTVTHTIVVDIPPIVTLTPSATFCGTTQNLTFDNTNGSSTKVTYAGSASTPTYSWSVTPPAGGSFAFTGGTTATSQYPKIQFTGAGTYAVSVIATNSCGSSTVQTENVTLQLAPTLNAGSAQTICQGSPVSLTATVSNGTLTSQQWSSPTNGSGSAFSSRNSLTTNYTPTAADIANGSVTLTITGQTGLVGACATVTSTVTITIVPTDRVTSASSKTICSGSNVGYNITASDGASTYSWTASVTTGAATGFSASGTSATINDVITNSNPLQDAVVTYVITPISSVAPTGIQVVPEHLLLIRLIYQPYQPLHLRLPMQ